MVLMMGKNFKINAHNRRSWVGGRGSCPFTQWIAHFLYWGNSSFSHCTFHHKCKYARWL